MASPSHEKYPYPLEEDSMATVSIKLSEDNYYHWRPLMFDFIESRRLAGFIDGTIPAPPEKISVQDDNSTNGTKEIDNPNYQAWSKSDGLLKRWIFQTLEQDVVRKVMKLKTARDVWTRLERFLSQPFQTSLGNAASNVAIVGGGKNLSHYLPLHKAALAGDWMRAKEFIDSEADAVRAIITGFSETALIVAVRSTKRNPFVKQLVGLMSQEDLALADSSGSTALHIAAIAGNIEAANLLVQKNQNLPNKWNNDKEFPIHMAAKYGQREIVVYLLPLTKGDATTNPFEDEQGVKLLHSLIASGLYDIALDFLQLYPKLASKEPSPLESLARKPSAFRSGRRFNIWQRLICSYAPLKVENVTNQQPGGDIENPYKCISVKQTINAVFWRATEQIVPQVKYIREQKEKHHQALQLVKGLCTEIVKLEYVKASALLELPQILAIRFGIPEIVEEIVVSFPSAVYHRSEKKQSMFHLAVAHRRENVFNLIYQFECNHIFLSNADEMMNNGLHLAGYLESQQKLNLRAQAAGAALQVQRELQWFKEVEKLVLSQNREQENSKKLTPAMAFIESHEELVKEGEQWMKDTANSCSIVAALIATVVFASAITVPGGNNSDSGLPIFSKKTSFIIFGVADALALFSSTSSVLMFLSILTSRYAEHDFLYALPRRLIIGLVTLFFSIMSMMVAFTATVYIIFGDNKLWVLIVAILLACLPVTLFVFLQFPLLMDMIKSTYYPGIFRKRSDRILF